MENNSKQMAASAGHAVAYTIGPNFLHIIDCAAVFQQWLHEYCPLKRLWLVDVFDGTPQIIVQRCQIAASRWPNDISSAADNAIFKNMPQNIECSLKPNVANILLFNFCEQKSVQNCPIAMDCNGLSLLIFEEKWRSYASGPKSASNSDSLWVRWLFNVFCAFRLLHTRQDQNELQNEKMIFLPKSASAVSRSRAHLAKRIHNDIRSAEG